MDDKVNESSNWFLEKHKEMIIHSSKIGSLTGFSISSSFGFYVYSVLEEIDAKINNRQKLSFLNLARKKPAELLTISLKIATCPGLPGAGLGGIAGGAVGCGVAVFGIFTAKNRYTSELANTKPFKP